MFVFLIVVARLLARSKLWRWRSMGRVRLAVLVFGLAWRLGVTVRNFTASREADGRHRQPTRGDLALQHSWGARGVRWASGAAARRVGERRRSRTPSNTD